jgi:glucose/arabinose dehydrogenase
MKRLLAAVFVLSLAATAHAQNFERFVGGLSKPVDFAADPTDDTRFYIVEQTGTIRVIEDGTLRLSPFFTADKDNFTDKGWEQGLLGMAFDPGYADNGFFYINYTGKGGTTHISRFKAASPTEADPRSEEIILTIDQPFGNHNGGGIVFGPDDYLYIGTGDGGAANDPFGNGQKLDTLLGKMLRIDVTGEPDDGLNYAIPDDNPFIDDENARPEIWAYGLRNPWRYSFDSKGRLWIGDVGQNRFEEIDLQPEDSTGGENYGWNAMEGFAPFRPGRKKADDPKLLKPAQHRQKGFEPPIHAYRQNPDASVTGGYFYEGDAVPSLKNRYIYAEFMRGGIWSFRLKNGKVDDLADHTAAFKSAITNAPPMQRPSAFGRGNDGELYLLDLKGGAVYKIVE